MSTLLAAKLVQKIFAQVATAEVAGVVALINFIRVACTGTSTVLVAKANWLPIDPGDSDELYEWCKGLKRPRSTAV